jgi:hypothetical protein
MKNKQVKQMIHDVEIMKRNGCLPLHHLFTFKDGDFGYYVLLRSGWFFRGVYYGVVSLTADQLRGITNAK